VTRLLAVQPGFDSRSFPYRHRVQTVSRVHPTSYPVCTRRLFPW